MGEIDGQGTVRAHCVLAPNPSPMTLTGTNTWLLAEPGSEVAIVVDPGPAHEGHLRRVAQTVAASGRRVGQILLTHRHADHSEGAALFAGLVQAPVRALDPAYRLGDEGLADGAVVRAGNLELRVIATPGHSDDSLTFHLPADDALLTGDTVLGRGTTVIADDGGDLAHYLDSLTRLRILAEQTGALAILPGHGPMLGDPVRVVDGYLAHRRERLGEVEAALAAGDRSPAEIVARVYADVDRSVRSAACWSVRAQLRYLADQDALPPGVVLDD